jgi:hypothetical protein
LILHFEVYPAHRYACDPAHLSGKLPLNAHHLSKPWPIYNFDQNDSICISSDRPSIGHRLATGYRPRRCQPVQIAQRSQAAPERASQQIAHIFHGFQPLDLRFGMIDPSMLWLHSLEKGSGLV